MKPNILYGICASLILLSNSVFAMPETNVDLFPYFNPSPQLPEEGLEPNDDPPLGITLSDFPLKLGLTLNQIKDTVYSDDEVELKRFEDKYSTKPYTFEETSLTSNITLLKVKADMRQHAFWAHIPFANLHKPVAFYLMENGVSIGYAVVEPLNIYLPENYDVFEKLRNTQEDISYLKEISNKKKKITFFKKQHQNNYIERYATLKIKGSKKKLKSYFINENALVYRAYYPADLDLEITNLVRVALVDNLANYGNL